MKKAIIILSLLLALTLAGLITDRVMMQKSLDKVSNQLKLAQEKIKVQDLKIETDEKIVSELKEDRERIIKERDVLNDALDALMQKPENQKWGCTNLPDDVLQFVYGLECTR